MATDTEATNTMVEFDPALLAATADRQAKDSEEVHESVCDTFENGMPDDSVPLDMIALVLQLDKELGINREDDKVVIHSALAMWLPGTIRIVSPKELAEIDERMRADEEREMTEAEVETVTRLQDKWFEVRFDLTDPETGDPYPCHPVLKDRTLSMRVMSEDESSEVEFMCASVRADGTLISVTKQQRTKF